MINTCKSFGIDRDEIMIRIQKEFELSEDETKKLLEKYYKLLTMN